MVSSLLPQCVLTGQAQKAYSSLSGADIKVSEWVKLTVWKVCELVPEVCVSVCVCERESVFVSLCLKCV